LNSDQTAEVFQLDELMMAMDVVDTLRHREELVLKEINDSDRREKLVKKIKDIYAAQGLDVPEDIITRGVDDLEEDTLDKAFSRAGHFPPDGFCNVLFF